MIIEFEINFREYIIYITQHMKMIHTLI